METGRRLLGLLLDLGDDGVEDSVLDPVVRDYAGALGH
jgi:hypothetical protein